VIPAVAALVAAALTEAFSRAPARLLSILFGVVSALCVIAAAGLLWLFGPSAGFYALPEIRPYAAILALTGASAGALWFAAHRSAAIAALASGLIALNYVFVGLVLPGVERSKPVPPLARTIARRAAPGAKLGYFNMGLQSFVYYTDRGPVEDIGVAAQARAFFLDQRESWAIMGVEEWNQVRELVPGVCVADRHSLSVFDARLPDIVARKPPPDVLLVKNHCDG
jgi:hypothetical protein